MYQETICLSSKSVQSILQITIKELFTENIFADVTLVSDDQIQIPAHKFVLSAGSPTLKNLLLNNPHPHPLIYMRGVKQQELQSILQFIYLGEARIYQDRIKEFLDVAVDLEIKELCKDYVSEEALGQKPTDNFNHDDEFLDVTMDLDIKDLCKGVVSEQALGQTPTDNSSHDDEFFNVGETRIYQDRINEFLDVAVDIETKELGKDYVSEQAHGQTPIDNSNQDDSAHTDRDDTEYKSVKTSSTIDKLLKADSPEPDDSKDKKEDSQRLYKCKDCNTAYGSKTALNNHAKSKHLGFKLSCNQCEYQTTWQSNLKAHQESKHEGVRYSCNQCEYKATAQSNLKAHKKSKHGYVRYSCIQCEYKATTQSSLKVHQESKHEGVGYYCNQCEYKAITQSVLKLHRESKHEGVRYSCNQCVYEATTQSNLKAHQESKHEGIKFCCNQCDYQTTWKGELKRHQESHEGVTYFCNQCEYQSTLSKYLKMHKKSKHGDV